MYPFDDLKNKFLDMDNRGKKKFDTLILNDIHNVEYTIDIGDNFIPSLRQDFFRIYSDIDYMQNYINILNKYLHDNTILSIGIHTEYNNYVFRASIKSIDISHFNNECIIWFNVKDEIIQISDGQLMQLMKKEMFIIESMLNKEDAEKLLDLTEVKNELDILINIKSN